MREAHSSLEDLTTTLGAFILEILMVITTMTAFTVVEISCTHYFTSFPGIFVNICF